MYDVVDESHQLHRTLQQIAMYDVDCVKMMKMVIYRQSVEYNKLIRVNILTNTRL